MSEPGALLNQMLLGIVTDLQEMRQRSLGQDGIDLKTLPAEEGLINDTIRDIAQGIHTILEWIATASREGAVWVQEMDAAMATAELARDIVVAFGEALEQTDLSAIGTTINKPGALDGVESAIHSAGGAIASLPELPQILPDVSLLRRIEAAVNELIVNYTHTDGVVYPTGAYGELLVAIRPSS